MEKILEYIKQKYNPLSIILYGSYANGTNGLNSDFDALVISYDHEIFHDTSFVNGIQLDIFVYPSSYFDSEFDCNDFVQIFDGKILTDNEARGKMLQDKVLSHLQSRPPKSKADLDAGVNWCIKMLGRIKRHDTEGMFRWHWLLIDTLEIFCDIMKHPYWGPKKSLQWMEENHPTAFVCYQKALETFDMDHLENWITYIKNANNKN